jgi:hypothetical protein
MRAIDAAVSARLPAWARVRSQRVVAAGEPVRGLSDARRAVLDLAHDLGEPLVHPLQRAQERADFVRAAGIHRMPQLTVRDALRHRRGMAQLPGERADQQPIQQRGGRQADGQQAQQTAQHAPAGAARGGRGTIAGLQCLGEQVGEVRMQGHESRLYVRRDLQLRQIVLLGLQLLERIVDRLLGRLAVGVGQDDELRLVAREAAGEQPLPVPLDIQAVRLDLRLRLL